MLADWFPYVAAVGAAALLVLVAYGAVWWSKRHGK